VNLEIVAKAIVAMLVGSLGLIAAVPLTTGLAALLVVGEAPDRSPGKAHSHRSGIARAAT
jgi:uncharacterized membrane protein